MIAPDATEPLRADALDGWPASEEQSEWYGDPLAEAALLGAFRSGAMHHAWLIGGPRGIGKATLAYRFARFVLANPHPSSIAAETADLALPADHPAARKVANRGHPNLLVLERPYDDKAKRFRTDLTVSEIRRTVQFFGNTAGEGGWRIAVVDPADDMNASAANALLKILEEPPRDSLFLLISHAPGRLLPTLRSRCRRLDLRPLTSDRIGAALRARAPGAPDKIMLAAALAEGSLRRAILLSEGDAAGIYQSFALVMAKVPSIDIAAAHALADTVSARGKDDRWLAFVDLIDGWLNRRIRAVDEPEGASPVSQSVAATPLERWAEVWENLRRTTVDTEVYNLDRKRTALTIMLSLARATRM